MNRRLIVHEGGLDASAAITARSDLIRGRDYLRNAKGSRAWLRTRSGNYELEGPGPLLAFSRKCLPDGDNTNSAASFIDALVCARWVNADHDRPDIDTTSKAMADVVRALGFGIGMKIGTHLPTPSCPGSATIPEGPNERINKILAHLLRDHPIHVMLSVSSGTVYVSPMGSRIHPPGKVRDPISVMRLLSTVPQELLS